jgi:hypothetical protein
MWAVTRWEPDARRLGGHQPLDGRGEDICLPPLVVSVLARYPFTKLNSGAIVLTNVSFWPLIW